MLGHFSARQHCLAMAAAREVVQLRGQPAAHDRSGASRPAVEPIAGLASAAGSPGNAERIEDHYGAGPHQAPRCPLGWDEIFFDVLVGLATDRFFNHRFFEG